MKRLSSRGVAAVTNGLIAIVVASVAAVCFFPSADPAAGIEENVYRKGSCENGVSLMVNVYWGAQEVREMLDVFDEYGAVATFFIGGCWADDNVDLVREIADRGHEIGTHGYFHLDHGTLDYEANVREIATSAELLSLVTHRAVTLFAPPSGSYCEETVRAASSMELKTVLWSRDTVDWRDKSAELVLSRATENVGSGELILMHPMEHTVAALPEILRYYGEHGLKTVTVGENLG